MPSTHGLRYGCSALSASSFSGSLWSRFSFLSTENNHIWLLNYNSNSSSSSSSSSSSHKNDDNDNVDNNGSSNNYYAITCNLQTTRQLIIPRMRTRKLEKVTFNAALPLEAALLATKSIGWLLNPTSSSGYDEEAGSRDPPCTYIHTIGHSAAKLSRLSHFQFNFQL